MKRTIFTLVAFAALAACGGEPAEEDVATMDTTTAAPAGEAPAGGMAEPAAAGAPTDPQIAGIVSTANTVDIEAAELAQEVSTNPEVDEFAQRMITDHTSVNQAATDLLNQLGVTPEESPTSQQLADGGDQTLEELRALSGAEFDSAYIAHEIEYHQAVLDAIDNTLIPNAQNAELRTLLEETRPAIEAHLQQAQQIQESLQQG